MTLSPKKSNQVINIYLSQNLIYFAEFEKIKEKTEIDAGNYLNSAENFINFFKEREPELEKEKFSKVAYSRIKDFENVK